MSASTDRKKTSTRCVDRGHNRLKSAQSVAKGHFKSSCLFDINGFIRSFRVKESVFTSTKAAHSGLYRQIVTEIDWPSLLVAFVNSDWEKNHSGTK